MTAILKPAYLLIKGSKNKFCRLEVATQNILAPVAKFLSPEGYAKQLNTRSPPHTLTGEHADANMLVFIVTAAWDLYLAVAAVAVLLLGLLQLVSPTFRHHRDGPPTLPAAYSADPTWLPPR